MTDDDLRDELLKIHGVGEAKADEIIETYEEHGFSPIDQIISEAHGELEDAVDYHDAGNHAYAAKFTRRALALLTTD